jgi:hypothetical protein
MYITNIDTISALLDRLISENIKLFFFKKDGLLENIKHQEVLITEIKSKITKLLSDTINNGKYDYISEKRTYKVDTIVETLEKLINCDITTGEGDRANLSESLKESPDVNIFSHNHKKLRKANELRAVNKNKLDEQYKDLIENKS